MLSRFDMPDIFEEIVKLKKKGEPAALATIISSRGSIPREVGSKMLIKLDGSIVESIGGGLMEARVIKKAMDVIKHGKSEIISLNLSADEAAKEGALCGGELEIFIEPLLPAERVYIFGGGHISYYLAPMASAVNFQVTVIDDREEFANTERFPQVDEIIVDEFEKAIQNLCPHSHSYIVIVTRGHSYDELVLQWALSTQARYIGMIGSESKIKTIFANLEAKGVPSEKLKKVHSPIGLAIGAQTPAEIAVSIIAELIEARRTKAF
jgi:xanthine dehydrogenase accessory factor